jgi:renalase
MHIAVIGAGMSGLTCALGLKSSGHTVVVYEKSRGVSGRMSTRRTDFGGFDHGAQYFTASSAKFQKSLAAWAAAGWIAPWNPDIVNLTHGQASRSTKKNGEKQRWVSQPGMRSLGEKLGSTLDVRTNQLVKNLFQENGKWLLSLQCESVSIDATAGPYDAVIVAVPADQAVALLAAVPDFSGVAESAKLAPCWTLMMAFERSLELDYDAAWVHNSSISWIARDSSKPMRKAGENWIAQGSASWSLEHLENSTDRAQEKLYVAFQEATGTKLQPTYLAAHRWRYSQSLTPLLQPFLWDSSKQIGACGDWFQAGLSGGGKIENAFLSGSELAELIDR